MTMKKRTIGELKEKLYSRNWCLREFSILQQQQGDDQLFEALYSILTDQAPPNGTWDLDYAARILFELNPRCPMQLDTIIRKTLPVWDLSVEQLPFYLANQFGRDAVIEIVNSLENEYSDQTSLQRLETIRYWLKHWKPTT